MQKLTHMTARPQYLKIFLLGTAFLTLSPTAKLFADSGEFGENIVRTKSSWETSIGVSGGYNQLIRGYDNYDNLGNIGLEIFMREIPSIASSSQWKKRVGYRFSLEYFPLQVPKGNNGLTEDIYSANAGIFYKFLNVEDPEVFQWVPFVGLGLGGYWDALRLSTPATGTVSSIEGYFGMNTFFGVLLPAWGNWRVAPEIKLHGIRTPGNYWSINTTYSVVLLYRFHYDKDRI
jgi:hypothetical protein